MAERKETRRIDYADGRWCDQDYENGELHGWWRVHRADGSVDWEREYVRGRQHGCMRRYGPDGEVIEEQSFQHDVLHGPWHRRNADGESEVLHFEYGYPVGALANAANPDFRAQLLPAFDLDDGQIRAELDGILSRLSKPTAYFKPGELVHGSVDEVGSFVGLVNAIGRDEAWPECGGRPLSPILQVRASDTGLECAPWDSWKLLTVFAVPDDSPGLVPGDMVIRVYRDLDAVRLIQPQGRQVREPSRAVFDAPVDDLPDENDLPPLLNIALKERGRADGDRDRLLSRISGWPGWLQFGRIADLPTFALQLDSLLFDDWECGDCTVHYVFVDEFGVATCVSEGT